MAALRCSSTLTYLEPCCFLRSAQRLRIASAIRFLPSGERRRLRFAGLFARGCRGLMRGLLLSVVPGRVLQVRRSVARELVAGAKSLNQFLVRVDENP